MTESAWLSLGMALITAAASGFAAWLAAKYGVKAVEVKVEKLHAGQNRVIEQNEEQEKKIKDVAFGVEKTAKEIDGRLTEYRRLVEQKALVDVAAALVAGEAKGIAKERERTQTSAVAVVELAKEVAKEVIATAEEKAKDKKE